MTRTLGRIVLLAVIVAAVGFYRGWFVAQSSNSGNKSDINVTVDKNAIRQDETTAEAKAREAEQRIKDKMAPATAPATQP